MRRSLEGVRSSIWTFGEIRMLKANDSLQWLEILLWIYAFPVMFCLWAYKKIREMER
jgi:hypothetical protein